MIKENFFINKMTTTGKTHVITEVEKDINIILTKLSNERRLVLEDYDRKIHSISDLYNLYQHSEMNTESRKIIENLFYTKVKEYNLDFDK